MDNVFYFLDVGLYIVYKYFGFCVRLLGIVEFFDFICKWDCLIIFWMIVFWY